MRSNTQIVYVEIDADKRCYDRHIVQWIVRQFYPQATLHEVSDETTTGLDEPDAV
jgi:hypothetical protein